MGGVGVQEGLCAHAVRKLHVHFIGDVALRLRGANNTGQLSRTVVEDRQRQGLTFVLDEVVAQAICLGAQTVEANRCVSTRPHGSHHIVLAVAACGVVEGAHQGVVRARVDVAKLHVATFWQIFSTLHSLLGSQGCQEVV